MKKSGLFLLGLLLALPQWGEALSGVPATVTVSAADYPSHATGVSIGAGELVTVSASGTWSVGGPYGTYGPDGATAQPTEPCAKTTAAPMGALVGSTDGGSSWFGIGSGPTSVAGPSSDLLLAANDCGGPGGIYYGDNSGSVEVTILPSNSPPNVSAAAPSIASIWPPNNKMVDIAINGVTDPDGDAVTITITGITNNETGTADAGGIGTSTAQVKATRFGKGSGRTYTISFTADDGKGGTASGSVTVVVPHDQGNNHGDDDGDHGKAEKKNDDKNKKTAAKAPGKRGKPAAVESATWGEIKDSMR